MKTSKGREYKGRVYVNVKLYTTDTGGYDMRYSFENNVSDRQFDSIHELMHFIETTPLNDAFRWRPLCSSETGSGPTKWTGTQTFEEAMELLKNGWDDMAKKLEGKLRLATKSEVTKTSPRPQYAMAGYQACVPRYLQGVPESMIYSKRVPVKQKVITINKQVNYLADVSANQIIEESVKALTIIAKLEAQGYRVNLNAVTCSDSSYGGFTEITRTCIKKAGERLSVAKMAFPLVNPSMLRRIIFRYRETNPESSKLYPTYGRTLYDASKYFEDKPNAEYYIPPIIGDVDKFIAKMELK